MSPQDMRGRRGARCERRHRVSGTASRRLRFVALSR